jgi:hypothetical protein
LANKPLSIRPQKQLRYVPLMAAGVLVFLGLVFLGDLLGLLWHIRTFVWWIRLNPSVLGPTTDWFVWAAGFLISICPGVVALARRNLKSDPVVVLTSVVFPVFSFATMGWSYFVGATLLVGSGFLAAYTLVSRSPSLLGIDSGLALRVVSAEVFGLLALISAGGVVSVLLWGRDFFLAMVSGSTLEPMDVWLSMLAVDLEVFYLARPLLSAILITLAVAAMVALFREPLQRLARPFYGLLVKELPHDESHAQSSLASTSGGEKLPWRFLPYLVLLVSLALGVSITLYPYLVAGVNEVLGVDSWFYIENLRSMNSLRDALPLLQTPRTIFIVLLFFVKVMTDLSAEWVVRLMPAVLSVLLALSAFALVREGTGRPWVAAFAALLSVVSAQTALGMSAGIINNWFALSVANFMFALIVRSIRLQSKLAAVGALAVSLVLLASYAFLWVVVIAELVLILAASILAFWFVARRVWRIEVGFLSVVLSGSVLIPIALLFAVVSLLGFRAQGIDPTLWFTSASGYLTQLQPQLLGSVWGVLEEAFDFAGNRIDLPFLTLLSVVGLLDCGSQRRSFSRIVTAAVLVPILLTAIISTSSASPYTPMWLTWRGIYVIPLYVTGALGAESIVRRVNGQSSPWKSPSRLAFAGTFTSYIFLSHLSCSLRALELLIMVAS